MGRGLTHLPLSRSVAGALVLTGCVLSIEPYVPATDARSNDRLPGAWEEIDGSDRAAIAPRGSGLYAVTYTDGEGRVGQFDARLGLLGGRTVLDVQPAEDDSVRHSPVAGALIRGHVLLSLDLAGDTARIALLKPESLRAAFRRGTVRLPYAAPGDELLLTAATAELQRGLARFLDRPGVFDAASVWRRASGPAVPAAAAHAPSRACFEAAPWREADRLFHRDPHWLGADVASSVDLGGGRILWLFGDTWIDPTGRGTRRGARMVSNTLAIQRGTDPTTASITFAWGRAPDGNPTSFFPDRRGERLWLGNGVRVDDRLVIFLGRIRSTSTGLGFESAGWTAMLIENPDDEPPAWRMRELDTPANPLGVTVGFAAVRRIGEFVYAFGSQDPVKSHPLFAARWPASAVRRGDLASIEWWAGGRLGWVPDSSRAPRWPLFENGASELTLHYDSTLAQFLVVQAVGFGPADVALRTAPAFTGPWTAPRTIYRPPEYERPNVMIYAAKAHPELTGADLALTYATNTFQFAEQATDSLIYYPRFVQLTRCR